MATGRVGEPDDDPDEIYMESFTPGLHDENLQEQRDEILALESFYDGGDFDKVKVLSSPDNEGEGLFFIHITLPVLEQIKPVMLDIILPDEQEASNVVTAPSLPGVLLNRSISGQRWVGSLKMSYLSPLSLQVSLPPSYPSHDAPVFTLSSAWLSPVQLSLLCRKLDELWEENQGMGILFTWIDWLENNIMSHLGIVDNVILKPFEEGDMRDPRGLPESLDMGLNIISLIKYNRQQVEYEFCRNEQECDVCFERLPGTHFYRIGNCGHHYCRDCMTDYCELHVRDGTVEELKCPDYDCEDILPPYIIQAVLPPAAFDRWERLMLQKTLTYMADVVWCPRCNEPVIKEVEETLNLAHCVNCFYSFCTECNESWHQGKDCDSMEDKMNDLNKKPPKNEAEERRFQELRAKMLEEMENRKVLQQKVKKCPRCKISVEKIAGCNKMTCRCGQIFCWICVRPITGYNHFTDNNNCVLFANPTTDVNMRAAPRPIGEGALRIQAALDVNPDARNRIVRCMICKQQNIKRTTNNHMKCWNCKTNFCFMCKKRLTGIITSHFGPTLPCQQHS